MPVLRRLLAFMGPYRWWVLGAYACLLLLTVSNLVIPRIIQRVIDDGIGKQQYRLLVFYAVLIVLVYVVKGGFAFGQAYLSEYVSQRVAYDVRNNMYDHLQRLSFAYHDRAQTGQIMSRVTADVDAIRMLTGSGLLNSVNAAVVLVSVLFLLYSTDWKLATLSLIPIPFLIFTTLRFGHVIRPVYGKTQQQFAVMNTVLQENLTGVRVVKAFHREQTEIEKYAAENLKFLKMNVQAVKIYSFTFPSMTFLAGVGTALTIWYGGSLVVQGRLSVGTLVAFNSYLALLIPPIRMLGPVVNVLTRAMASGERIFQILDAPSPVRQRADAIPLPVLRDAVRFEDVSFGYRAGQPVLKGISVEARSGEVVALVGSTGAGKSTLINLIPRFYDVSSGRITIDGHDVRDVTFTSLRRQIGMVLQESFLFSATIRENIAYGKPDATQEQVEAAARAARAHDFIESFAQGYDTEVGERGVTLSGGQKQRISIARALLMDPRILLLDDSTASVDSETEHLIQEALQELMRGRTTFVIAQRLSTVRHADQILVLDHGEIVERGKHEELLAYNGMYAHLHYLQSREQQEAAALGLDDGDSELPAEKMTRVEAARMLSRAQEVAR